MTEYSISSPYTKREVLYFKAKSKPVYVFQPNVISKVKSDYLDNCKEIKCINPISFN